MATQSSGNWLKFDCGNRSRSCGNFEEAEMEAFNYRLGSLVSRETWGCSVPLVGRILGTWHNAFYVAFSGVTRDREMGGCSVNNPYE